LSKLLILYLNVCRILNLLLFLYLVYICLRLRRDDLFLSVYALNLTIDVAQGTTSLVEIVLTFKCDPWVIHLLRFCHVEDISLSSYWRIPLNVCLENNQSLIRKIIFYGGG